MISALGPEYDFLGSGACSVIFKMALRPLSLLGLKLLRFPGRNGAAEKPRPFKALLKQALIVF
jgi:hypothetical protein